MEAARVEGSASNFGIRANNTAIYTGQVLCTLQTEFMSELAVMYSLPAANWPWVIRIRLELCSHKFASVRYRRYETKKLYPSKDGLDKVFLEH